MKEKIIWVTGGSSGIGKAISQYFVKKGFFVACSSRNENKLKKLQESFNSDLLKIFPLDVSKPQKVREVFNIIEEEFEIECLVNNAGITTFKLAVDTSFNEIEKIISTNLLGSIYTIKSVIPSMIKNGKGTIINIISVVAKKIFINSSVYSASKAGLLTFSDVLREEVRGNNIRIINVLPGAVKTSIWHDEILEKFGKRMMKSDDVAGIIYKLYMNNCKVSQRC